MIPQNSSNEKALPEINIQFINARGSCYDYASENNLEWCMYFLYNQDEHKVNLFFIFKIKK